MTKFNQAAADANLAKAKNKADKNAQGYVLTQDGYILQADLDAKNAQLDQELAALLPLLKDLDK